MTPVTGERVFVAGLGASTAVGRSARASAAAVRAAVSGFAQHPHVTDSVGEPVRLAVAPWLGIDVSGRDRFEALLLPAVEEAMSVLHGQTIALGRCMLALALASERPGLPPDLASQLGHGLGRRLGEAVGHVESFPNGHAAGLIALRSAFERLRTAASDVCIVCGVDSWVDPLALAWLEQCDQLHGAGPLNNAWGFIPGEGGAAVLLVREGIASRLRLERLAEVVSVGVAHESKSIKSGAICIGEGLTAAFHQALDALPDASRVDDIYCDMNGEAYRADEYGFTVLRTQQHFESPSAFTAPADCWGDSGAASGVLNLVLACVAWEKRYANGDFAFAWSSSESGDRAAALMAAPPRI